MPANLLLFFFSHVSSFQIPLKSFFLFSKLNTFSKLLKLIHNVI